MKAEDIIKKPVLTEKSLQLAEKGWFTFLVDKKASKGQIKQAIENLFKVEVAEVRVLNVSGKPKRWGRFFGRTQNKRKALVKLTKGKIDIFKVK
ncbi:50S ribosomal protein L23 [bacterium]|nr:50S ribosomal protein L23 [bacterium]